MNVKLNIKNNWGSLHPLALYFKNENIINV